MNIFLRKQIAAGVIQSTYSSAESGGDGAGGASGGDGSQDSGDDTNGNNGSDEESVASLKAKLAAIETEKADLLKDAMRKKNKVNSLQDQLKAFGDVTPERLQEMLKAESERQKAEQERQRKELEDKGEFETLRKQMVEQHNSEKASLAAQIEALMGEKGQLANQILDLTVGNAFSTSKFISEKTVLPASKARRLYSDHFDVSENGEVVGFDKPTGSKDRTMIVDGNGLPVSFDVALERIINADSDKDSLLRSTRHNGAGSNTNSKHVPPAERPLTAEEKIAKGLTGFLSGNV